MPIVELCQSPFMFLTVIAMLFFILAVGAYLIHFLISNFRNDNQLIQKIDSVLSKGSMILFTSAVLLVILYIVLPTILNVLVDWNLIEYSAPCMMQYQPSIQCEASGNITKCMVPL